MENNEIDILKLNSSEQIKLIKEGHLTLHQISKEFDKDANRDKNLYILLCEAVAYGDVELVKNLLSSGAHPHGSVLLQLDSTSEHEAFQILLLLVEAGVDLDFPLEEADTILMKAAGKGWFNVVKLLVENGANINQINQNGESALIFSSYKPWKYIYEYLYPLTNDKSRLEAEEYFS